MKIVFSDELLCILQALREKDREAFDKIQRENFGFYPVLNSENTMYDEIIKLRYKHIITTNLDMLIERYFQDETLSEDPR